MTLDRKKPGVAFWTTVVVASVVIYVLSSGPARTLLIQKRIVIPLLGPIVASSTESIIPMERQRIRPWPQVVVESGRWKTIYFPLDWAAAQNFGALLRWYWDLFPISASLIE